VTDFSNVMFIIIIIIIIIIITIEKIKVMLSRKRCRGTSQDYKKGEISKCLCFIIMLLHSSLDALPSLYVFCGEY